LTIYTFKENMIASVLFRGTGIAMTLGLGAGAIAAPFLLSPRHPWKSYVASLQASPVANAIVKFGVAFPFAYHGLGGIRHLLWDNIIFHTPELARKSGPAIIAAGVALGVAAAVTEFKGDN
jgi:succinate dehydrogenase (ubiquinone) cytochrome b560 subunit